MTIKTQGNPLSFGDGVRLPANVATCPECGGRIHVRAFAWDEASGRPIAADLQVECVREEKIRHRWWQSDWQPVVDVIRKWAGAIEENGPYG